MQCQKIFMLALLFYVGMAAAPALATYNCDPGKGGKCHCAGGDNCKELDKSGMCGNNSLTCHSSELSSVGYTCDCNAKLGVDKNSLKVKQPLSKSQ